MRAMGGGGGSVYTAYTFWAGFECKLDRGRPALEMWMGVAILLDCPRESIYLIYVYASPPGGQL